MDTNGPLVGYSGCQSLRTPAAPSSANGQLQARRIRRYSLQRPSNSESITEYRLIFSTMSGFKIKINSSPESVLLHVPGIGTATARRIIVMRNNGITITPEILAQIPYMKNKMSLVSDMIDFSPCEFNDMDNVDVSRTLQPEVIDPAYGPHYVEYEPSDKPDLPSLDRSMSIQHDSTTMIEVQLNQQPRLVGEHCTEHESSTAMKEQHFENTHLNDRFQQSQTRGTNQSAQSPPTVANQPINHRATGQQPPQPNINRSNPLPALRSTPPVREREPYQQLPPTVNRANQPPCPRSTGQLQSTRQQNYTFPVGTADNKTE
ncbi:unnamed protein product [Mytilus edulis]|uniref:Uncharacterized protein n=1 Tax=Mytilus edulis TaxID=6550 RepID=A0A8S3UI11_MYTED|nr:unnamed protein product [Mytilus edulis]